MASLLKRRTHGQERLDDIEPHAFWAVALPELLTALGTAPEGLSSTEARLRLARAHFLAPHHRRTELILLLRQFSTPITLILISATLISAVLGEAVNAGIILAIVLASGLLSFWQENSASRAMADLLDTVEVTVELRRDGRLVPVRAHEVVAGDIVVLDTGDLVPGDCRIVEAEEVLIDEAPLTGESYPVEKSAGVLPAATALANRTNCLFKGTHLVRGVAEAVVVTAGDATEFGKVVQSLEERVPSTSFEAGISAFGALLLRVVLVLVTLIFAINLTLGRPAVESFLFSVAIAVGLTPQLLPAIVSISLSIGARLMARARVIVKRLSAIEDFGAMDILCTDKTGTLTMGSVALAAALDPEGKPSERVLAFAVMNARHHTGYANPIDDAILQSSEQVVLRAERLAEVPYDFMRKRLSVLIKTEDSTLLVMKGAFENVLSVCEFVVEDAPLERAQARIRAEFETLSADGYRVLGLAIKEMQPKSDLGPADEASMTFAGFLVFQDPIKAGVDGTLRELRELGISLRMVTGDNRLAAQHVARAVGLQSQQLLIGDDIEGMSDERLEAVVTTIDVFAEVDPVQKARIIRALRRHGHTVGFLGDGINDAPALHAADVGISVDTAVDVAKDSASIVLLAKDLDVLMRGVKLGRQTFANTLKYVFVTTSANFGNMASVAGASLFLPYLPLLPLQILLLNLLSDLPATTIATDAVDEEQVQGPEAWDIHSIRNFMVVFGLISSVFDFMTFGALRLAFDASAELFRSGWFLESLGTELAVMLILRTRRRFYKSRPGSLLLITSVITGAGSVALVLTPLSDSFGFVPPSAGVLVTITAILAGYVLVTEVAKDWFYGKLRV